MALVAVENSELLFFKGTEMSARVVLTRQTLRKVFDHV